MEEKPIKKPKPNYRITHHKGRPTKSFIEQQRRIDEFKKTVVKWSDKEDEWRVNNEQ